MISHHHHLTAVGRSRESSSAPPAPHRPAPRMGGSRVSRRLSVVILFSGITVEEVHTCHWRGSYWIAVLFINSDGVSLWTNYSRGNHEWMLSNDQPPSGLGGKP